VDELAQARAVREVRCGHDELQPDAHTMDILQHVNRLDHDLVALLAMEGPARDDEVFG
jgi:hypothetical protein